MEAIVKAIKICGEVNTFICDILDPIIKRIEFLEKVYTFVDEYFHKHPDEINNVYFVCRSSNPSLSLIKNPGKISLITNLREKFFNDQEPKLEVIMKKGCNQEKMKFCLETKINKKN